MGHVLRASRVTRCALLVKCELWRRWKIDRGREVLLERLYVKQPSGQIWCSDWRPTGMAFYQLWRTGIWHGVPEVEPGARLVGKYKLPERGPAANFRAKPLEIVVRT